MKAEVSKIAPILQALALSRGERGQQAMLALARETHCASSAFGLFGRKSIRKRNASFLHQNGRTIPPLHEPGNIRYRTANERRSIQQDCPNPPHPSPLPGEREQQPNANCFSQVSLQAAGSGVQCANPSGNSLPGREGRGEGKEGSRFIGSIRFLRMPDQINRSSRKIASTPLTLALSQGRGNSSRTQFVYPKSICQRQAHGSKTKSKRGFQ
jgi:hypothetical protein